MSNKKQNLKSRFNLLRVSKKDTDLPYDLWLYSNPKEKEQLSPRILVDAGKRMITVLISDINNIVILEESDNQLEVLLNLESTKRYIKQYSDVFINHWKGEISDRQALNSLNRLEKNLNQQQDKGDSFFVELIEKDPVLAKSFCYPEEISFEDVVVINKSCLFEKEPHQVIDKSRIESAIGNQFQPYERRELAFASVYKSLVINHGFLNGNKRTAAITLYMASIMLGNPLKITDQDFAKLTYKIASENGSHVPVEDIAIEVFSYYATVGEMKRIANDDVAKLSKTFVNEHKWLMKELGK